MKNFTKDKLEAILRNWELLSSDMSPVLKKSLFEKFKSILDGLEWQKIMESFKDVKYETKSQE